MTEQIKPPRIPPLPETAPFTPAQRAWLDGFFAGLFGEPPPAHPEPTPALVTESDAAQSQAEDFPWHDPTIPLPERMKLAAGRPLARRLMAAMAQMDCGQCSYLCQSYAEALATGAEKNSSRCVPGSSATARALKELLAEAPAIAPSPIPPAANGLSRSHPVSARLVSRHVLNRPGAQKEVRHIVLALPGDAPSYQVGDSLGVFVRNCPNLVAGITERLGGGDAAPVRCADGATRPLGDALLSHCDIARPSDAAVELVRERAVDDADRPRLQSLLDGSAGPELAEIDVLDLLTLFPHKPIAAAELAERLLPLQPRLYSISSSPRAHPGEVHLTVSAVRWERRGRRRFGVASTFMADRLDDGQTVSAFVQAAGHFALAPDDKPIIMIGPGTGIAPFRAFLAEREARAARGASWLFFGDQRRALDFLYEEEIRGFQDRGVLTRLDLAFSRDQARRIYVQDRMRRLAKDLWSWLADGAHVYVCGDAQNMARDVHRALIDIVREQRRIPLHEAEHYWSELRRAGRYQRDVY